MGLLKHSVHSAIMTRQRRSPVRETLRVRRVNANVNPRSVLRRPRGRRSDWSPVVDRRWGRRRGYNRRTTTDTGLRSCATGPARHLANNRQPITTIISTRGYNSHSVRRPLQLRSSSIRRPFDCLSKVITRSQWRNTDWPAIRSHADLSIYLLRPQFCSARIGRPAQ